MTIKLTQDLKEAMIKLDPYYSQKQQLKIFGMCVNTMMKLRKQAGLDAKPKGRPKGTGIIFKDEEKYPQEIVTLTERIPEIMAQARKLASENKDVIVGLDGAKIE